MIVGSGKLIDPANIAHVYISPRRRAMQTFELAFDEAEQKALKDANKISETGRLAEWDYGLYEGMLTKDIRALRKEHGLDAEKPWDIWRDGCENGE
jgi:probable phosphoglycerate mutase